MDAYEKEDLALDALIALILKNCDVSDERIKSDAEEYLAKNFKLSPNYKKSISKIKDRIFLKTDSSQIVMPSPEIDAKYEESFMAMHRDNTNEKLDKEIEEEIKRRRQQFIDEKKKKKANDNKN